MDNSQKIIKIALVGKYTQLTDAYASVSRSLIHAATFINHKVEITVIIYFIYPFVYSSPDDNFK